MVNFLVFSVIGGLLSAHMLSGVAGVELDDGWPCSGPLLNLAERVASKLLPGNENDFCSNCIPTNNSFARWHGF